MSVPSNLNGTELIIELPGTPSFDLPISRVILDESVEIPRYWFLDVSGVDTPLSRPGSAWARVLESHGRSATFEMSVSGGPSVTGKVTISSRRRIVRNMSGGIVVFNLRWFLRGQPDWTEE